MQVSDFLLERLREWGVTRIYGYPGDGINGILGALDRASKEGPEFIQARHEEMSAFMVCAHAKFTGQVGVCLATSGPGAIHLLNGLYDAKLDHQPVLAIVGQQPRMSLGGNNQQEGPPEDQRRDYPERQHPYAKGSTHQPRLNGWEISLLLGGALVAGVAILKFSGWLDGKA